MDLLPYTTELILSLQKTSFDEYEELGRVQNTSKNQQKNY